LSQGTERLNLPLKCFVFVIKPSHHFGAWIRAIVRDFDDCPYRKLDLGKKGEAK
jgi:hypothetical protein